MAGLGGSIASPAISSILHNLNTQNLLAAVAAKPNIMDRHHYSGPSGYSEPFSSSGSKGKHNIALTALTFLAFIFFLNILQNCLQEQMKVMNPDVIVMQPGRAQRLRVNAQERKGDPPEDLDKPETTTTAPKKKKAVITKITQNHFEEKEEEENPFFKPHYDTQYREHLQEREPVFSQPPENEEYFNRRYDRIAKSARFDNSSINYGKIQRVDVK